MKGFIRGAMMVTALTAWLGAGSTVAAQAGPPPAKIAFITARVLLQGMPGYVKAESTFTKELEAAKTEMQRMQAQLQEQHRQDARYPRPFPRFQGLNSASMIAASASNGWSPFNGSPMI